MTTIYHPTLDATRDVPESDVARWKKSGWLTHHRDDKPSAAIEKPIKGDEK